MTKSFETTHLRLVTDQSLQDQQYWADMDSLVVKQETAPGCGSLMGLAHIAVAACKIPVQLAREFMPPEL